MLVTITNTSGITLNTAAVGEDGLAVGEFSAHRTNPFPFPFGHIGELADSATKELPMQPADFRYKPVPWVGQETFDKWNLLVQKGYITVAVAAQTDTQDTEELYLAVV